MRKAIKERKSKSENTESIFENIYMWIASVRVKMQIFLESDFTLTQNGAHFKIFDFSSKLESDESFQIILHEIRNALTECSCSI